MDRVISLVGHYGYLVVFFAGFRVFGALVGSMSRMYWSAFAFYNVLGGVVWVMAVVSLGYFLWASISLVEHWVGRVSLFLLVALALALLLRRAYRRELHVGEDLATVRSAPTTGLVNGCKGSQPCQET